MAWAKATMISLLVAPCLGRIPSLMMRENAKAASLSKNSGFSDYQIGRRRDNGFKDWVKSSASMTPNAIKQM